VRVDATVLVVEDERHLADLYAEYLEDAYSVVTAYSGEEGLERLTTDVDVVLVDQRMPMVSGNEVVAAIQNRDVEYSVAMITDDDPDFDVMELGVDDYLVKPVTQAELLNVVDRLLAVSEYTEALRELTRKKLVRNVLRVEKSGRTLDGNEQYRELEAAIGRLETTVDTLAAQLDLEEAEIRL
jgi:DNA-binding response OmpR family regulator